MGGQRARAAHSLAAGAAVGPAEFRSARYIYIYIYMYIPIYIYIYIARFTYMYITYYTMT